MISKVKEAENRFDRGINYFRGGFFSAALQEFIAVKRIDKAYSNIDYFIEATSKKNKEVVGKLSNFIEENFSDEINELSSELTFENSNGLLSEIKSLVNQGKPIDALKKLEKAEAIVPDSRALLIMKANIQRRMGLVFDAEKTLERVNRLCPDDFEILNNLGNVYLTSSHFESAERVFSQALNLKPNDPKILNNIGSLKMQINCLDEAEKLFRKSLAAEPSWSTAVRNLENVQARIDYLDDKIDKLRREFTIHPNFLDIGLSLGKNLFFRGHFSDAKRTLTNILKKNEDLLPAYFYLGMLHELNENFDEAIQNYDTMVIKSERNDLPEYRAYTNLVKQGHREEALAELKKIAVIELNLAASRIELGIKYFEDCMWKEALSHFKEATEINEGYPDGFYWMALTYIQLRDNAKAKKAFEKTLEIKPDYSDAHFQMGMLLRKRSKKKAKAFFQKALDLKVRSSFAIIAKKYLEEHK